MENKKNFLKERDKDKILKLLLLFSKSSPEIALSTADYLVSNLQPDTRANPNINVQIFRNKKRLGKIEQSITEVIQFFTGLYAKNRCCVDEPHPIVVTSNKMDILKGRFLIDAITGETINISDSDFFVLEENGFEKVDLFNNDDSQ
ncbi:hypothetical protein [Pectobacterium versatile]|uniref:hypothetical protein n=1 Tax=Pectobacterium versatile TaxID=2488639 RepID=UPI001F2C1BA7|nr:hypothetical protein [Pectobacterium versatile]